MLDLVRNNLIKKYECFSLDNSIIDDAINNALKQDLNTYIDIIFESRKYIEFYLIENCKDNIDLEILLLEKYKNTTLPIRNVYDVSESEINKIYEDSFEYILENYNRNMLLSYNILSYMLKVIKNKLCQSINENVVNHDDIKDNMVNDIEELEDKNIIKDDISFNDNQSTIQEIHYTDNMNMKENDNSKNEMNMTIPTIEDCSLEETYYDISFLNRYLADECVNQVELVEYMGISHNEFYSYKTGQNKISSEILNKLLEFLNLNNYAELIEIVPEKYFYKSDKSLFLDNNSKIVQKSKKEKINLSKLGQLLKQNNIDYFVLADYLGLDPKIVLECILGNDEFTCDEIQKISTFFDINTDDEFIDILNNKIDRSDLLESRAMHYELSKLYQQFLYQQFLYKMAKDSINMVDYICKDAFFKMVDSLNPSIEERKILEQLFEESKNEIYLLDSISKCFGISKKIILDIYKKYLNFYNEYLKSTFDETLKLCLQSENE